LEDEELHHRPEDERNAGDGEREPEEESNADAACAVVLHAWNYRQAAAAL